MAQRYIAILTILESSDETEGSPLRQVKKQPVEIAKIVVRADTLRALNHKLRLHVGVLVDEPEPVNVELKPLSNALKEAERRSY